MTIDVITNPLMTGMESAVGGNGSGYDRSTLFTHYRCAMSLYDVSTVFFILDP